MHEAGVLSQPSRNGDAVIYGARCAVGPRTCTRASIRIIGGRVTHIVSDASRLSRARGLSEEIDLSDFLIMPGLINAHDHLQFALHPRIADPPYQNYIDWG